MEHTSIDKAIDVLFYVHARPAACGVTAISAALGIPKSSTHRLLATLTRRGLLERGDGGRYAPGMSLVALGLGVLDRDPIVVAARPVLEHEARELDETLFLTAARSRRITVLDKVEGSSVLRASPQIGSDVPVHATAVGKLYLAFSPEAVEVPTKLQRFTAATRKSRALLDRDVAIARERGWAENREEWHEGLVVIAAPVLVGERMAGAVTLAAPTVRLPRSKAASVGPRLRAAADTIAGRLRGETQ